jgi:hypothetical protein
MISYMMSEERQQQRRQYSSRGIYDTSQTVAPVELRERERVVMACIVGEFDGTR